MVCRSRASLHHQTTETSYPGRKPGFPLQWITAPLLSPPLCIHADARQLVGTQQHPGLVPASPRWKGWHEAVSAPHPLLKSHSKTPNAHMVPCFSFHPSSIFHQLVLSFKLWWCYSTAHLLWSQKTTPNCFSFYFCLLSSALHAPKLAFIFLLCCSKPQSPRKHRGLSCLLDTLQITYLRWLHGTVKHRASQTPFHAFPGG